MRICLLTSSDERCGVAVYGQHLMVALPEVKWTVIGHREWLGVLLDEFDLVVVNYEPGLFPALMPRRAFVKGQKTILIMHTSHAGDNHNWLTHQFNRVVVHEPTTEGFDFIPMATPAPLTNDELVETADMRRIGFSFKLGTVGFPFPWKGFDEVADAAKMMGGHALVIAPKSEHKGADWLGNAERLRAKGAFVATKWMDERYVLKMLNCCDCIVFAYHGCNPGISGAVRLGLACGRPVVVTKCRMFRDLEAYADEIGVAESPSAQDIYNAVEKMVTEEWKLPKRVLAETNWEVVGRKYLELFNGCIQGDSRMPSLPVA